MTSDTATLTWAISAVLTSLPELKWASKLSRQSQGVRDRDDVETTWISCQLKLWNRFDDGHMRRPTVFVAAQENLPAMCQVEVPCWPTPSWCWRKLRRSNPHAFWNAESFSLKKTGTPYPAHPRANKSTIGPMMAYRSPLKFPCANLNIYAVNLQACLWSRNLGGIPPKKGCNQSSCFSCS